MCGRVEFWIHNKHFNDGRVSELRGVAVAPLCIFAVAESTTAMASLHTLTNALKIVKAGVTKIHVHNLGA